MSYPHYQITVPFTSTGGDTGILFNATGDKGFIFPQVGMTYYIRRLGFQPTTTVVWATGAKISFRLTTGKNTSATGGEFATLKFPCGKAVAKGGMYFNDSFTPKKVQAGYGVAATISIKATGKIARLSALIEPSTERLQNYSTGKYVSVTG